MHEYLPRSVMYDLQRRHRIAPDLGQCEIVLSPAGPTYTSLLYMSST